MSRLWILSFLVACHGELVPVGGPGDDDDGVGPDAAVGDLTWEDDVGPMLAARGCTGCHGDDGNYSVESYADALGPGSDAVANVIPGDESSALVRYVAGGHGGAPADDLARLEGWVVDSAARER